MAKCSRCGCAELHSEEEDFKKIVDSTLETAWSLAKDNADLKKRIKEFGDDNLRLSQENDELKSKNQELKSELTSTYMNAQ